jgi:PEP-CTERM motif-containing protein
MRQKLFAIFLGLIYFTCLNSAAARTMYPVGGYNLTAVTDNPGEDVGTVSGRLFFDASSNLTFADIAFNDLTIGKTFTFTNPGPSFIMTSPEITGAEVFNAVDPDQYFDLFVGFPSDPSGIFALSHCGVPMPCGTFMQINADVPPRTFIHVTGEITPIPEPGSLILLGTGALAVFGFRRRFFQQ